MALLRKTERILLSSMRKMSRRSAWEYEVDGTAVPTAVMRARAEAGAWAEVGAGASVVVIGTSTPTCGACS